MQPVRRALDTDIFELGVALATHAQLHLQAHTLLSASIR
jgi:hypothetical protein